MKTINMSGALMLAVVMSGCGTTQSAYQAQLDTLLGASETEMILQFGPPVQAEAEERTGTLYWESERITEETSSSAAGGIAFGITMQSKQRCELRAIFEDGDLARFEWRASRSAVFGDEYVDELHAGECGRFFPVRPREPNGWSRLTPYIGRMENELVEAYGKPPIVHVLEGGARLLSWSDALFPGSMGHYSPDPDVHTEGRATRRCIVGFVVTDGIVTATDSWGQRTACPLPANDR
ncbi:MAG: hypothetical protein OXC70_09195 [Gammaproteobacteria bacterium]|nr:hypothetical protein [Gammaproteobacteria bacterium]